MKAKPVVFLMHTEMDMVLTIDGNTKWHGTPPNDEQFTLAIAQIKETIGDY